MATTVWGNALLILAAVIAVNALAIAVGWANARTQPKATDRPYLIGTASPLAYVLLILLVPFGACVAVGAVGVVVSVL